MSQKIESVRFFLPQVLIITTPGRRKLPISPEQCFLKICFSPAERGEDYGVEKMTKIKLVTILVTSFDKLHLVIRQTFVVQAIAFQAKLLSHRDFQGHTLWL